MDSLDTVESIIALEMDGVGNISQAGHIKHSRIYACLSRALFALSDH